MSDEKLFNSLYRALKKGRKDTILSYIDDGGDVNIKSNDDSWSLLMAAANFGQREIVDKLISKHANINYTDKFGLSALALAASGGHYQTMELLFKNGADINVKPHGEPLIQYVKSCGKASNKIYDFLISKGAV